MDNNPAKAAPEPAVKLSASDPAASPAGPDAAPDGSCNPQIIEPDRLARAITLHQTIEELRDLGRTRQLRLREKLELIRSWDELKSIVLEPADAQL